LDPKHDDEKGFEFQTLLIESILTQSTEKKSKSQLEKSQLPKMDSDFKSSEEKQRIWWRVTTKNQKPRTRITKITRQNTTYAFHSEISKLQPE